MKQKTPAFPFGRAPFCVVDTETTGLSAQLTGITDSMLSSKGVPLKQALEELHGTINGIPAFAHNASFDRRFLNAAVDQAGVDFQFTLNCSIPAFKRLLPARRGYGLGVLAAALNVDGCGAHRALADSLRVPAQEKTYPVGNV